MPVLRDALRSALRFTFTAAIVAAVTAIGHTLPVNATTAGFAYVITVLLVATSWGIREAVFASVASMLSFNFFFLPPFGTLTIADPQNWLALFAFLVTAIVASELSTRARREANAAIHRQRELERLHALGRSILLDRGGGPLPQRLAQDVAESFELPAVALYDIASAREYKGGPEDLVIPESVLSAAISGDIGARTDNLDSRFALIRLGGKPAGVLGLRGDVCDTTVDAISNLVAIGLERARTQEAENRAEAARTSEELKSALLDAIAHEFKTPLTSIKAATTSILGDVAVSAAHRELLSVVDEEADRLNGLVSDAIEISRIEGSSFTLDCSNVQAATLFDTVMRQMRSRLQDRSIERQDAPDLPPMCVDQELIQLALRQLLDNAAKYSPPAAAIRLGSEFRDGRVVLWVADDGPGISAPDAERVFERFYRGWGNKHGVPGTGLGLSVVRQIARAHGGDAVVARAVAKGARFEILLPVQGYPPK